MNRTKLIALITAPLVFILLTGCNPVAFELNAEGQKARGLPSILINEGAEFTNLQEVQLALHKKSAKWMYVTNNSDCASGGEWEPYKTARTWSLKSEQLNGPADVFVIYQDEFGEQTTCVSDTIVHDDVPPSVEFTRLPKALGNQSDVHIEFQGDDQGSGVDHFECLTGETADYEECPTPFFSTFEEGPQRFDLRAVDRAGNRSETITYNWVIDLTRPTISFTLVPQPWINTQESNFEFVAEDENGITGYRCKEPGASDFSSCTNKLTLRANMEASSTLEVIATDGAGNESLPLSHTWQVDVTGPVITFSSIPVNMKTHSKATLAYQVEDLQSGLSRVECQWNDAFLPCDFSDTKLLENLLKGDYEFSIRAWDQLGNESQERVQWSVIPAYNDQHKQVHVDAPPAIDLLIVVDNSLSMSEEQQEMGRRFNAFIDELDGLDWQLGITTTDPGNATEGKPTLAGSNGTLLNFMELDQSRGSYEDLYVLDSQMEPSTATTLFQRTIHRSETGSNCEQGLFASQRAVERIRSNRENRDLFRDQSHLAVIVLSDEDECRRSKVTPQSWIQTQRQTWGMEKTIGFHSIITQPGDRDCAERTDHSEGHTYSELSRRTDGIIGNICSDNYTDQLKTIGGKIRDRLTKVELACPPIDIDYDGKVDVLIESQPKPDREVEFTVAGSTLLLTRPLPQGSHQIEYHCF